MPLADLKLIEKIIEKIVVKNLKVGYNKEENKIVIDNVDNSTHIHYHVNVTLSPETIALLFNKNVEKLVKDNTLITVKEAIKEEPGEMAKLAGLYNPAAFSTAASGIVASNVGKILTDGTPLPSGDFIGQLPDAIKSSLLADSVDIIKISEDFRGEVTPPTK